MTVVVDASVALKWVLEEELTGEALALRTRWIESEELTVAPPIFRSEVTNALHRAVRRGDMDSAAASSGLGFLVASTTIEEPSGLYGRAFDIAAELSQGATYDSLYVALAEYHRCELWTADRRLVKAAQRRFPAVRWLGEVALD